MYIRIFLQCTDPWTLKTWLLQSIDSNLCGFLTIFPCFFFFFSFTATISMSVYQGNSLNHLQHASICEFNIVGTLAISQAGPVQNFVAALDSATNSLWPLRYCSHFHISPSLKLFIIVSTYYNLCCLHVAKIIQYGHYYQLFLYYRVN